MWHVHSPAGGAAGSLLEGAAAVSVGVGLGAPLVSVLVAAGLLSLSFLRLKRALSLSIASRAVVKKFVSEEVLDSSSDEKYSGQRNKVWKWKLEKRHTNSRHVA